MNKKLQKNILEIIKEYNNHPMYGELWTGLRELIIKKFMITYSVAEINHNLSLLQQEGKIGIHLKYDEPGGISITSRGYIEFYPPHKKLWFFITDDLAKILSVIATILSILAIIASLIKFK